MNIVKNRIEKYKLLKFQNFVLQKFKNTSFRNGKIHKYILQKLQEHIKETKI